MFLPLAPFHAEFCYCYVTMTLFTLIVLSTVGRKLHLLVKQLSQRWELMGHNTKNTHVGLVSRELSLSFRDGALLSFKKGSACLVCYYWPTDVRVSVTCLVKRKEFEGRGERGLLCNKPPVTHQQQHERDKQTHWGTLQASHSLIIFYFSSFSCFLCFAFLQLVKFCFLFVLPAPRHSFFSFSISPHPFLFLSYSVHYLIFFLKYQVSSTSLPLLVFLQPACGLAFYALTCTIAG